MPGPEQMLHVQSTAAAITSIPALDLGPAICADDEASRRHEWLLTNGRGGYACGSIANTLERRYHAVLCTAIRPPDTRSVVVAKMDERILVSPDPTDDLTLTSDVWKDSGLSGFGHRRLLRCRLHEGAIEHLWTIGDLRIQRRMMMPHGEEMAVVEYRMVRGDRPVELAVKIVGTNRLADYLDPGATWMPSVQRSDDDRRTLRLPEHDATRTPVDLEIRCRGGRLDPGATPMWYRGYALEREAVRGYDDVDDLLRLGEVRATLAPDTILRVELATGPSVDVDLRDRDPFEEERCRLERLQADADLTADAPPMERILIEQADRFVVDRPLPKGRGASIVAGYPWFADWGRDTMISLPGLCLATGRIDIAKEILTTFAAFESEGMLPNRFPGEGREPEYNTADAALLFIEAIGRTWTTARRRDAVDADGFLRELVPVVDRIIDAHRAGTRHGIRIDPSDGLLDQGEPGLQLTWMDARIGDTVVTPRAGKAVELNGLLHSVLRWRARFGTVLDLGDHGAEADAARVETSFTKFWMDDHGYLADVVDGPHGFDGSLRPNQLIATGCAHPPVTGSRAASVLDACTERLLTPTGLRTLEPEDPRYQPRYGGDQATRDAAYHMGTSWPWLLGPYCRTHWRIHRDTSMLRSMLAPMVSELSRRCLGGIAEVHDGDDPHTPGGCLSQAWSVAEVLWTLHLARLADAGQPDTDIV